MISHVHAGVLDALLAPTGMAVDACSDAAWEIESQAKRRAGPALTGARPIFSWKRLRSLP